MTKNELRKGFLKKRKDLSEEDLAKISEQIINNFLNDFSIKGLVHIFLPIKHFNEINTWPLVDKLFELKVEVASSIVDFETMNLSHLKLTDSTSFMINEWGVPEPKAGENVDPERIDMVIIPLVVCDLSGYRIGYGQGFYDKFLSECSDNVIKVGFTIFEPVEAIEDIESHDVALDSCVSPNEVYQFTEG